MSEEQSYRETIRGVRGFMAWNEIPDFEPNGNVDNNPFSYRKDKPSGKVSLDMPPDDWLCSKMEKLNITVATGYPSSTSDAAPLARDQFLRHNTTSSRWYSMYIPRSMSGSSDPTKVTHWDSQSAKVNSGFNRIARAAIAHRAPASRQISQETLRKWERSAKTDSIVCNQAAGLSRCMKKVQESVEGFVKVIKHTKPGNNDFLETVYELEDLLAFQDKVTAAVQRSIQDLTDSVFNSLANMVLLRRDSYLDNIRYGVKPDTLSALRTSPLHASSLFSDILLSKAEQEIVAHESKGSNQARRDRPGHLYRQSRPSNSANGRANDSRHSKAKPAWKQFSKNKRASTGYTQKAAKSVNQK